MLALFFSFFKNNAVSAHVSETPNVELLPIVTNLCNVYQPMEDNMGHNSNELGEAEERDM